MTTAVQVQSRRGTAAQVAAFIGAQGEVVVDTTNNRVIVQDGSTAGGWPMAGASRLAISDASYTLSGPYTIVAFTALSAARTLSLPATTGWPSGQRLLVIDESGACSPTKAITLSANGTDKIDGASSAVVNQPYGYIELESNAAGKWTISDQGPQVTALNGLAGQLTLTASDGSNIAASGNAISIGGPGGMVNKFRNGTMDVWQRGTSMTVTTAGAYSADGWIVTPAGASVSVAQAGGRLLTKNSLQVTGAASVTDVQIAQRIESLMAVAFCSQTVTVQAQIYNGTGGTITPTLTVKRPSTQDGWSGSVNTDVNAVALQSCPASAWTLVSYAFAANAGSYNGLQITFDFGNNFGATSKTVQITELDIRVTPGAATGLNSNPPPVELRPIGVELPLCQRYFASSFGNGVTPAQAVSSAYFDGWSSVVGASSTSRSPVFKFPQQMRATPTITSYNPQNSNSNVYDFLANEDVISTAIYTLNAIGFRVAVENPTGAAAGDLMIFNWTASAEL